MVNWNEIMYLCDEIESEVKRLSRDIGRKDEDALHWRMGTIREFLMKMDIEIKPKEHMPWKYEKEFRKKFDLTGLD